MWRKLPACQPINASWKLAPPNFIRGHDAIIFVAPSAQAAKSDLSHADDGESNETVTNLFLPANCGSQTYFEPTRTINWLSTGEVMKTDRMPPNSHGIVSLPRLKPKLGHGINKQIWATLHAALVALVFSSPAMAQTYTVADLGTLGANDRGSYSQAFCINSTGQVAGQSSASSSSMTDPAFLYVNGQLTSLGTLGGEYGQARGINTSGQIAGYSTLASGSYRAFLYTGGQMTDLGTLGADYSAAYALNDSGQVVGVSEQTPGQERAFLYSNGQMTDLGTLGGSTSAAYGINNRGVIAGYSYNAAGNFLGFILSQRDDDRPRNAGRFMEHCLRNQRSEPDYRAGLHDEQSDRPRLSLRQRQDGGLGRARGIEFLRLRDQQRRHSGGTFDHSECLLSRVYLHERPQDAGPEQPDPRGNGMGAARRRSHQ